MRPELSQITRLVLGFGVALGPLVGLMVLLNLRDRRQAKVLHAVLGLLSSRELCGRIAVQVKCGLLVPGSMVSVQIVAFSWDEIRDMMTQFSYCLSPEVRLAVTGPPERYFLVTFMVKRPGQRWRGPDSACRSRPR